MRRAGHIFGEGRRPRSGHGNDGLAPRPKIGY
jgi:hypothetical protein